MLYSLTKLLLIVLLLNGFHLCDTVVPLAQILLSIFLHRTYEGPPQMYCLIGHDEPESKEDVPTAVITARFSVNSGFC